MGGLSCAERIAKAKIAKRVNAHTSNGTVAKSGYAYHFYAEEEVTKDMLDRTSRAPCIGAWLIARRGVSHLR